MNQPSASLRRHWLCIAYAFPPINRSGTHRTLGFVRHLDALGWDSTVLTVEPDGEPCDLELLSRVPSSTTILRAAWQIAHCRLSIADCRLPIGSSLRPGAGPLREASRVPSPLRAFVPSSLFQSLAENARLSHRMDHARRSPGASGHSAPGTIRDRGPLSRTICPSAA